MPLQSELNALDRFFAETVLKGSEFQNEEILLAAQKLMQRARLGHLCVLEDEVKPLSFLPSSIVGEGNTLFPKAPIVRQKNRFYLQKNWVYETYILQRLDRLEKIPLPFYYDIAHFEKELSLLSPLLSSSQTTALKRALTHTFLIIYGGPGTGKTYAAGHLAKLLYISLKKEEKKQFRIFAAAPTGKAAACLQASLFAKVPKSPNLQIEAATLHRLLRLQPGENRLFSKRKIDADLIIVDEASMIDIELFAHLLESVGEETVLLLLGDPDQLPPVEAASCFAEIASLYGAPLQECMRTEEKPLQELATYIKEGDATHFSRTLDLAHPQIKSEEAIPPIETLYRRMGPPLPLDPKEGLKECGRFRILNAMRQGPHGTDFLNQSLLSMLQQEKQKWAAPILSILNDPFSKLYNGIGGVLIGQKEAFFLDPFSDELCLFSPPPPYELAFCLSIHKSQGSEFGEVLALFPEGSESFGREALYTAVTRAKKAIEIRGGRDLLQAMLAKTSRKMNGFLARRNGSFFAD